MRTKGRDDRRKNMTKQTKRSRKGDEKNNKETLKKGVM